MEFDFSNPENWTFVACCYLASPSEDNADYWMEVMDEIADLNNALDTCDCWDATTTYRNATPGSRFSNKGTCDHCGAAFLYGAAFRNEEGQVAVVGHTCAAKYLHLSGSEYADMMLRRSVKSAKTKAHMKVVRAENEARIAKLGRPRQADLAYGHNVSMDLRRSFIEYGSLTKRQWALARRVRLEDWAAPKTGEPEPAPIPAEVLEGRATIQGVLLGTKVVESYYGDTVKMLVQDDRGFKVWGTYPTFKDEQPEKGDRVKFDAVVECSKDDETFGFFKRPTKAEKLA